MVYKQKILDKEAAYYSDYIRGMNEETKKLLYIDRNKKTRNFLVENPDFIPYINANRGTVADMLKEIIRKHGAGEKGFKEFKKQLNEKIVLSSVPIPNEVGTVPVKDVPIIPKKNEGITEKEAIKLQFINNFSIDKETGTATGVTLSDADWITEGNFKNVFNDLQVRFEKKMEDTKKAYPDIEYVRGGFLWLKTVKKPIKEAFKNQIDHVTDEINKELAEQQPITFVLDGKTYKIDRVQTDITNPTTQQEYTRNEFEKLLLKDMLKISGSQVEEK
ncbi:MAG: hypothetical protein AB1391_01905 [Candidatus Micrarchaeota archaeon]